MVSVACSQFQGVCRRNDSAQRSLPHKFPIDLVKRSRHCIPAMAAENSQMLKLAGGMALGATALMVASGTLKKSLRLGH